MTGEKKPYEIRVAANSPRRIPRPAIRADGVVESKAPRCTWSLVATVERAEQLLDRMHHCAYVPSSTELEERVEELRVLKAVLAALVRRGAR